MATPAMEAALKQRFANLFGAIRIDLPAATVRLLDGAASLSFDGGTYTGKDPVFGVLDSTEEIADGIGDEAPALSFTLLPPDDAAAADLTSPAAQGSAVKMVVGAFIPETGTVVPDPLVVFLGELDVATLNIDRGKREVDFECVSAFELYFENQEGVRLVPSWHRSVWPDEAGLDNVTGVENDIYWGRAAPKSAVYYSGGGVVGGGGSPQGVNYWVQLR